MKRVLAPLSLALVAACVPPDKALSLGSVEVTVHASIVTREGVPPNVVRDGWAIRFERTLLSFKTVTVGDSSQSDTCSYRGSAEKKNAVFDLRQGLVQSFNGMLPGVCGSVGAIFAPPDGDTVPLAGATADDLVDLASANPAHLIVRAIATRGDETYTVDLRLDTARTSSKLAGCQSGIKGVSIKPNERTLATITFTADQLFRDALSTGGAIRVAPFVDADFDQNHIVTMDELDRFPLTEAQIYADTYVLALGGNGSMGDFVRAQFRFAWLFDLGTCSAKDPGAD